MESKKGLSTDSEIGYGAENYVLKRHHSDESARNTPPTVIKIPNELANFWQTLNAKHIRKCINSLSARGFRVTNFEIHEKRIIKNKKGEYRKHNLALEAPYDPDIDKKALTYENLTNEKIGPGLLRELIRYLHAAEDARKTDKIGYDPLGGGMAVDVLKGIFQSGILAITSILPKYVRKKIQRKIKGIQGKVRNLIIDNSKEKPELVCIDPGMHDFSERGKLKLITSSIHFLAFAGMIQLIINSNKKLPEDKQLSALELENLPYADNIISNISAKILWTLMQPMFDRYVKMKN